jgi:hypothetical protein
MVYPDATNAPLPNPDLADDLVAIYREAASISSKSPRAAAHGDYEALRDQRFTELATSFYPDPAFRETRDRETLLREVAGPLLRISRSAANQLSTRRRR